MPFGVSIHDPVGFQEFFLNRKLWSVQRDICRSIESNALTAVKGCHASGKTFVAAGLPLWWLTRHTKGKVFTTGPTLRQVKTFWKEITVARRDSRLVNLIPEPSTTGLELDADRYALGASSSTGVNIQGFHGDDVLIIADEAPGIESDIWDSIEGIRAGGNVRLLALGNPVVPSGQFYDYFARSRAICNGISISAFDTPNFINELTGEPLTLEQLIELPEERLDCTPFPALITRRWVKERYLVWGPNHPKFRSRVLAEFPAESPYAVFNLAWIEKAKRDATEAELKAARGAEIQVGIDVAGAGSDETALCARVHGMIIAQHAWHEADPRGAVARILSELKAHKLYRLGPTVVDVVGIGYNFALHLADLGFDVFGFNAGSRALDPAMYVNQKADAYFTTREWFREGLVSGLADEECEAQLATVQYRETSRGLIEIESKDDLQERGLPSPDRAEAVIMSYARIIPAHQRQKRGRRVEISPI